MTEKNIRLRIILILILLISFAIGIRIIYLSSTKPEDYNILGKGEYGFKRGDILDRNGNLLALSDELDSVYANPKVINSIDIIPEVLSKILNMEESSIKDKIEQNRNFVWIKRQITPNQAKLIKAHDFKGIGLRKEYKRFYPNKELASHILGFCNIDGRGAEGIEKSMDAYLISDMDKLFLAENSEKSPDGFNVFLTIDSNIQAISEKILTEMVKNEKADEGSIILLDGKTGEIISMANYPNFNPNSYKEFSQKYFRNYSIFNQFEPGSVLKIFTMSALLDSNNIELSDFFYCDGSYHNENLTVKCTGVHGTVNYFDILKYSCNSGMLQASENIAAADLYHYLKLFSFGERTSTKLPGEQSGILRNIDHWSYRSMFSIPLGQEISVNGLQIAKAATTFVNDGIMIEPFIIKQIVDSNNRVIREYERKEIRRVIKKGISQNVLSAMKTSTDHGGTVSDLYVEGIEFAAKSGTGEIFDKKIMGYLENDFTSSLLTIFPFSNPRYILYVVFHKPKGNIKWGGVIGAKTIKKLVSSLTGYIDFNSADQHSISKENIKVKREYKKLTSIPARMPDLRGLSAGDITDIFSLVNIKIEIHGSGRVYNYLPQKGETINKNTVVKIYLKN